MNERNKTVPNVLLKQERLRHNWSQVDLAEKVGASVPSISRWERGELFPDPIYRQRLCQLFDKSPVALGFYVNNTLQEPASLVPPLPPVPPAAPAPPEVFFDATIPPVLPIGSLIGREQLLEGLKGRLCNDRGVSSLAALNGLPGVGKTAVVVEFVHDAAVKKYFRGGILWAALGPKPNIASLLGRWGTLLGLATVQMSSEAGIEGWAYAIRAAIAMRRMLIVIDDAWQIEEALTLKVGGPNCAYLLTTRFPEVALYFADEGATVVRELNELDGISLLARLAPEIVAQEPSTGTKAGCVGRRTATRTHIDG